MFKTKYQITPHMDGYFHIYRKRFYDVTWQPMGIKKHNYGDAMLVIQLLQYTKGGFSR